ncbi:hypothetical protein H696_04682, partial [Fonticula alba]
MNCSYFAHFTMSNNFYNNLVMVPHGRGEPAPTPPERGSSLFVSLLVEIGPVSLHAEWTYLFKWPGQAPPPSSFPLSSPWDINISWHGRNVFLLGTVGVRTGDIPVDSIPASDWLFTLEMKRLNQNQNEKPKIRRLSDYYLWLSKLSSCQKS